MIHSYHQFKRDAFNFSIEKLEKQGKDCFPFELATNQTTISP